MGVQKDANDYLAQGDEGLSYLHFEIEESSQGIVDDALFLVEEALWDKNALAFLPVEAIVLA